MNYSMTGKNAKLKKSIQSSEASSTLPSINLLAYTLRSSGRQETQRTQARRFIYSNVSSHSGLKVTTIMILSLTIPRLTQS